jgi:SAM-dependent methyltransferase
MKIEEIDREKIKKESNAELRNLRFRLIQLYEKHFSGNDVQVVGTLTRDFLLSKYMILKSEMDRRGIPVETVTNLDRACETRKMRKAIWGLDVPSLGDMVIVENYISIGGSFIKSPKDAKDIDMIIRDEASHRDEGLELKLGRLIHGETGKDAHFVYAPKGPHSSFLPIYDLVLRPKSETKITEVKESPIKKSEKSPEELYFERLDKWDESLQKDNEEVIRNLEDGSVLDLGCGTGILIAKLRKDQDRVVQGIDKNDIAIRYCQEKKLPILKIDLEKESLPFDSDLFDNVISVHVLEHLENPKNLIDEATRVAKKKVIFLVPLGARLDPTHKHIFEKLEDLKKLFSDKWSFEEIPENRTVLATLETGMEIKKAKELRPDMIGSFPLPKPTMRNLTEAFTVDQVWPWCESKDLEVEPKLNGFRICLVGKGGKVRIITDGLKDRTKHYPDIITALEKVPDDFILDCSMGIERDGKPLPRIKLMTLMSDKPELQENDRIICTVFDLPYFKDDIHLRPFEERRKLLEEFYNKYLKGSPNFDITQTARIKTKSELEEYFKKFGKLPQSEGVVIKDMKGIWPLDGNWDDMAKLKHEVEIKVIVLERHDVKGGGYNYTCGLLSGSSGYENLAEFRAQKYINLGKCFNTKLKAEPGDILTMGVEEIIPDEEKNVLQWLGARVIDIDDSRKTPYFANQVIDIAEEGNILQKAEEGNIDYKIGDKGKGVLQIHIMGIEEEKIDALKKISKEAVASRNNPMKLKMLFKGAIGQQGAHIDMRLVRSGDKYFEGGEIMIGNFDGLEKLKKLDEGGKLRFGWKVARKEEPQAETIRGPVDWMDAGKNGIEIFPPGEAGATTNKYGAMLILDEFTFEAIEPQDDHAKKFNLEGNKLIPEGTYLMAYVPITEAGEKGPRVWMISKLKEEEKARFFKFIKINKKQQIVGGVIYEPMVEDSQGDYADAEEIQKAMYKFMEKYFMNQSRIKIMHKGKLHSFPILECFQPEEDTKKGKDIIKAGSWWVMIKIADKNIWQEVEKGVLKGFSMAGVASEEKVSV